MLPLTLYNAPPGTGPNPWKVQLILTELSLPFTTKWIPYSSIKSPPFNTVLNPNGRLPVLVDPNHNDDDDEDITLFESGAIIQYLIATYDTKERKISYGDDDGKKDKWLTDSWLHFQMSGQGPMFGQKMWFTHFHPVKGVTTAIERYGEETRRILGVLEGHLSRKRATTEKKNPGAEKEKEIWLVGSKCTYADLAFVPWNLLLFAGRVFTAEEDGQEGGEKRKVERDFPEVKKWHDNLLARPAVKEVVGLREEAMRTMEDSAGAVLPERK